MNNYAATLVKSGNVTLVKYWSVRSKQWRESFARAIADSDHECLSDADRQLIAEQAARDVASGADRLLVGP